MLARRYQITEAIGGGAMADVYRAHDRVLDRDVALKVLRPAATVDPELAQRFARESETIASIVHPNVIAVTDHGVAGDEHYLAMEVVDGPTLQRLLLDRGHLAEDDTMRIGHDVAAGLAAAHAGGVIHRDLKPANILIAADGRAKVGDFGIAHLEAMNQLTRTGEVLGTPRYIAPEQVSGRVDARADVYALGVVLYEMATGRPPFEGDSPIEIVSKHLRDKPVPPRRLVPSLSGRFEKIVLRALEKDPAKRFASAAALRDALRPPIAAPVPAIARPAAPRPAASLPRRAFGAVIATAALLLTLNGPAVARAGAETWRAIAAPASATASAPAATVAPTVAVARTAAPIATPRPTPTATPIPTAAPTESPAPTVRAATPTAKIVAPSAARTAPANADVAAATIAKFYELVTADRFDDAAALWSTRMRAAYPPATNIYGRFSSTKSIGLTGWSVAVANASSATVNVNVVEIMNDGSSRRWVGQWLVVSAGGAWLMDQPALVRA